MSFFKKFPPLISHIFLLLFVIILTVSGCALLEHIFYPENSTKKAVEQSDLGSAILSLLSTEHQDVPLSQRDIQETFSWFCNQVFQEEISGDSISFHYSISNPEKSGIMRISPSFGEQPDGSAQSCTENYLYLLEQFPYDQLTEEQKFTYDLFKETLENSLSLAKYGTYAEPISKTTGIQAQLPVLLCEYAFYSSMDVEDYLALLSHLPAYFTELADFEQSKADAGMFMHPENAMAVTAQCAQMAALANEPKNFMVTSFEERLDALKKQESISKKQIKTWKQENQDALAQFFYPAYQYLGNSFEILLQSGENTGGLSSYPDGRAYYECLVRSCTGSNRTISELKNIINETILSCAEKMQPIMADQSISDTAIDEADQYRLQWDNPKDTLTWLQKQTVMHYPKPRKGICRILTVPPSLSEYLSPAFYLTPPIDAETENCIYINEPQIQDELSFFTTLAHEGYPGHLYQNVMFSSTNPQPLRELLSFPGYIEGWATYAELSSYYFSGLSDTAASLQRENALLTLCMYAMSDIHVHYDGYTESGLLKYLNGFGVTNEEAVHEMYLQILAEPANYLKYTIGCLEFLALREECEDSLGGSFDEKAFHKAVLETGPCSFAMLRESVQKKLS